MYQASIAIGKSAASDVTVLQTALATVTPPGSLALLVGEATTLSSGEILKRLQDCADVLTAASRPGGGLLRAQANPAVLEKAGVTLAATDGLAAEAAVAAVRNSAGTLDGQTLLVRNGLLACLDALRERIVTGQLATIPA
jgi:hypothetical protein